MLLNNGDGTFGAHVAYATGGLSVSVAIGDLNGDGGPDLAVATGGLDTIGSAWFSQEEGVKGRIAPGQYADFTILSADCFAVPDADIRRIQSVLTVVAGRVVSAAQPFAGRVPVAHCQSSGRRGRRQGLLGGGRGRRRRASAPVGP